MPTDNHDFRQPPRGQQNWDQDWYHNFDTLDERVVARGLDADRTEYTPYQNALYLATDTENIYRGTGNGWEQLESYGVNPEFGQATADKVTLNNEPTNPNDAARLQDVESSGGGGTQPGLGGTYSTTGDGTSTTFSWDTGIDDPSAIEYVSIDPASRSASTDYTRFIDGTSIGVEYDVAPDDGVTLSWFWTVNATIESITVEDHDHSGDTINPDVVNAQTASVSTPPSADTDVVRNIDLEDISGGDPGDHDHTGDTLNPNVVNAQSASVSNAPSSATDVARQSEITTLDSEKADQSTVDAKADQDGGGTASLSNYGSVDADELTTTAENGTETPQRILPFREALSQGYLVGWTAGYHLVIDPDDYASDAAAMQAANDQLIATFPSEGQYGEVWIPPFRPDGTEWVIDETVYFSNGRGQDIVLPQGWGFHSNRGQQIQCNITDGSAMFHIEADTEISDSMGTHRMMNRFGGFSADAKGDDCEAIRIVGVNEFYLADIWLNGFGGGTQHDGCVTVSNGAYGWAMDGIHYNGTQTSATVFAFVEGPSGSSPGMGTLGGRIVVHGGCRRFVHMESVTGQIRLSGHYEAAHEVGLNIESGVLTLSGNVRMGNTMGDDQIWHNGAGLVLSNGVDLGTAQRHMIHIGPDATRFNIPPFKRAQTPLSGDAIHIQEGGGSTTRMSTLPFEEQLRGSITNNSSGAFIRYPNGMGLEDKGTATVPSGGEVEIDVDIARTDGFFDIRHGFAEQSTAGRYRVERYYNGTMQRFVLVHVSGGSIDVDYEIYASRGLNR